jgi:hypothetical protein
MAEGSNGGARARALRVLLGLTGATVLAIVIAALTRGCGGMGLGSDAGPSPQSGAPSASGSPANGGAPPHVGPAGAGAIPADGAAGPGPGPTGRNISFVFVIAMENDDASVYGNHDAFPYLNDELLPRAARADGFADELPLAIPSEPHYVWMEAGTNVFSDRTFTDDSNPSADNSTASGDHLVTQLMRAGTGWTSYQEGIDATSGACPIAISGYYRPRHNPFVFFRDVAGDPPSMTAPVCAGHHKPLAALASDLAAGTVTPYNFITPDLCHDSHGAPGCPGTSAGAASDDWMRANLPAILAFVDAHAGVLFIVWDEGDSTAEMPFLAAGPHVKAGYASSVSYTHSSLLKSLDEIFGLPTLATVSSTNDLADLFEAGFFP